MISVDDVTLTTQVSEEHEVRFTGLDVSPWPDMRKDHEAKYQRWWYTSRLGLTVAWCEAHRILEYKISVPRLWKNRLANFPLHDFMDVGDLPARGLRRACRDVLRALGLAGVLQECPDPIKALDLHGAGVRRISYTVDLKVEDLPGTLRAIAGLRRRRKLPTRFEDTGVQWRNADRYKVQFYNKAAQLMADKRYPRPVRQSLAAAAEGILRIEVTLPTVPRVRDLVGLPSGYLPTLELMLRPDVRAHALRRELFGQLHMDDLEVTRSEVSTLDGDLLAARALEIHRRLPEGQLGGGIRTQLQVIPFLEQTMGDDTLCEVLGITLKTLGQRRTELRRLGYLGPHDLYSRVLLRRLLEMFKKQVPDSDHLWEGIPRKELERHAVPAPWAPDEDEESMPNVVDGLVEWSEDLGIGVDEYEPDDPYGLRALGMQ